MSGRDQQLYEQVIAALQDKLETESLDIKPIIQAGKVILTGVVDVYADKMAAENAVSALGVPVENGIAVVTDGNIEDSEIKAAVERKLRSNQLPVVGVDVHKGKVHLQGTVSDAAERQGIATAITEVMGVSDVDANALQVEATVDDASLTNMIEVALVNAGLDAADIDTQTHHGVTVLMGWVRTEEERQMALHSAAKVRGVRRVVDRLRVRQR